MPTDEELKKRIQQDLNQRGRHKGQSEGGQDEWVLRHLNGKKGGFFIDCGAGHPSVINNTWRLEKEYEWNGICIEPNRFFFEDLYKERDCLCLNMAVSNEVGWLDFRLASFGSSLKKNEDTFNKIKSHQIVPVFCDSLIGILKKAKAPKQIDYLDLDIPGAELDVVSSFDFNLYDVKLLTVRKTPANAEEVQSVLESVGFVREVDLFIDMAFRRI